MGMEGMEGMEPGGLIFQMPADALQVCYVVDDPSTLVRLDK